MKQIDDKINLSSGFAKCFNDERNPSRIEHSLEHLIRQRLYGLSLGYEDVVDYDDLQHDALFALGVGKQDIEGKNRRRLKDRGKALAGKGTINPLELDSNKTHSPAHKISMKKEVAMGLLCDKALDILALSNAPKEIIIDFDATDNPIHGAKEGKHYHGYYKEYCYLPLYGFIDGLPVWAELRQANIDASLGTLEALEKIVPKIRTKFGEQIPITFRADSGFARDKIMNYCIASDGMT